MKLLLPLSRKFGSFASLCCVIISLGAHVALARGADPVYRWTTLAGRVTLGDEDGPALDARFNHPTGVAADLAGNLYVADTGNHTIRKITPQGVVSTFAGKSGESGAADGTGSAARFNAPRGVGVDADGYVYVADTGNHTIRKLTPAGVVSTLAGQAGKSGSTDGAATTVALLDAPDRLSVAPDGTIYLFNHGLRKISGGAVQTIQIPAQTTVIDGRTLAIGIHDCPAIDAQGRLYFWSFSGGSYPSEYWGFVATMDPSGQLSALPRLYDITLGTAKNTVFNDSAGNIYATFDYLRLASGEYQCAGASLVTRTAGTTAWFGTFEGDPTVPSGVAVAPDGHWYFTRTSDSAITRDRYEVYAGVPSGIQDGVGSRATFDSVSYLSIDSVGNIWVAEARRTFAPNMSNPSHQSSSLARKISPNGEVRTASAVGDYYYYHNPTGIAVDQADNIYLADSASGFATVYRIQPDGTRTSFPQGRLTWDSRSGLASDSHGNLWTFSSYDADKGPVYRMLRCLPMSVWQPVAGGTTAEIKDGIGEAARISRAYSLITDSSGNAVFLDATYDNNGNVQACFVRRVTPLGEVVTLSRDLAVKTTVNGVPTTRVPAGVALTKAGLFALLDSDSVRLSDGQGNETVIGGVPGVFGSRDGVGNKAGFLEPTAIRADAHDNLYVMDQLGTVLRKGEFLGYQPGIAAQPQSLTVATGGSAQFSVTAAATAPTPTYQWFFNNTAINGATTSTLTLSSVNAANAGDYTVVVANDLGSVTSNKATLTITGASTPPPTTPSSGGGSGGGGAPSVWFLFALLAAGIARRAGKQCLSPRQLRGS
ncbi:MAG: immunoglobulin domain-containing protein [Opitutae bacterium]|nr:immunoglobulin domain-containing protein [Opitutae bacterium]